MVSSIIKKPIVGFDAMGGDFSPAVTVKAAFQAALAGIPIHIFGDQTLVEAELSLISSEWRLLPVKIIHCSENFAMGHSVARSVLLYKDSSLVRMVKSLAEGTVDVVVSSGNSGALVTAGVLFVGLFEGILKPALSACLPTIDGGEVLVLDLGGTVDCRSEHLSQFAFMGALYMQAVQSLSYPRVALLSNGHEEGKGSAAVKVAYRLLAENDSMSYQFVGNIESRDIFDGRADVVVVDGFAGNLILKMAQGVTKAIQLALKKEAGRSLLNKFALMCARPLLGSVFTQFDYTKKGGALVLGLKKPIFVSHGSAPTTALFNAIIAAEKFVKTGCFDAISSALSQAPLCRTNGDKAMEFEVLDL